MIDEYDQEVLRYRLFFLVGGQGFEGDPERPYQITWWGHSPTEVCIEFLNHMHAKKHLVDAEIQIVSCALSSVSQPVIK